MDAATWQAGSYPSPSYQPAAAQAMTYGNGLSPVYPQYAAAPTTNDYAFANPTSAVAPSGDAIPLIPDVVANPWNTSLLWSGGIMDNRDPRSTFWPLTSWHNSSVPSNVDTSPIEYYYQSTTAGDFVNFYFIGHGLSVLDYRGPRRGRYNVSIDDATSFIIDAYSDTDELAKASGSQLPPVIWTSETLYEGTHSVVMTNLNNLTEMDFWGVVINPNNYRAGKSFMPSASNVKTIIIASSVTATIMFLIFILVGSLIYYCKLVRPRRRLQAQMNADRKEALLPNSSSSQNTFRASRQTAMGSSSRLRLDTTFLSSQGDLGRVPSRVTAATNESQYWVRPQSEMAQVSITRQPTTRTPALFQEIRLGSPQPSTLPSPTESSPTDQVLASSTFYSTTYAEPASPLSPNNPDYAIAHTHTHTHNMSFRQGAPASQDRTPLRQPVSHQQSNSLNMVYQPTKTVPSVPAGERATHLHHSRISSLPNANPFQDPIAPSSTTTLVRAGSRRPLPTPPTATTPISPMTTISPFSTPTSTATATTAAATTSSSPTNYTRSNNSRAPSNQLQVSSSARRAYRTEQDACSLHMSEDGMFDDHTGETLLPPPYAPRDMGRHFV
ncbi:hypothetical protein NDA11_005064 [Ustilago hordei]|uniref:Transmembrane protein n=1 Tax=Ustilago hordei TaxID=120017 RepID=I2FQ52_USTHO|nr:uncharacterized protein UHO2_06398 [Ustilago hordei]KAJ1038376.1 hypothetical protein NDA10_006362 [Ustilago hordei]KAJ1570411.1 hypothetical protein NDA15_005481 [Ustilago hordei]KAJ1571768.1 hypothetical protein NDA12_002449 [Ustilago hordei]KAJ1575984.1 hypothetical protein NDA11_005064 [Ustilago hordei]KAJ1604204.1 hypothetical protein NDA14_005059 [Ustilago hordei]